MTFIGPEKFFLPSCTSRGQTFSRIYLTSVAVAGPLCSACHAAACVTQQAGTDFSRWIGSEAEQEPLLFRRHFRFLLRRSREIYPLFPHERQMQRGTSEWPEQSLRSIYRQCNAKDKWPPCPVTFVSTIFTLHYECGEESWMMGGRKRNSLWIA